MRDFMQRRARGDDVVNHRDVLASGKIRRERKTFSPACVVDRVSHEFAADRDAAHQRIGSENWRIAQPNHAQVDVLRGD